MASPPLQGSTRSQAPVPFRFNGFRADPDLGILRRNGEDRRLGARAMAVLSHLASRPGELVSKEELISAVWGEQAIGDDSLSVAVYQVRKALGDDARKPRFLETVPSKGYRWLGDASGSETDEPPDISADVNQGVAQPYPGMATPPALPPRNPSYQGRFGKITAMVAVALAVSLLGCFAVLRLGRSNEGPKAVRPAGPPTVAVLPLADYSPMPGAGLSFADGMTESLISALVNSGPLQVVSGTSVRHIADRGTKPLNEIGQELGADLFLEGSITLTKEEARISLQLVEGRSNLHLWAKTYDGASDDRLRFQSEVADAVAHEVRRWASVETARPSGPSSPSVPRPLQRPPLTLEAVKAYLEGRRAFRRARIPDVRKAIEACRRAIAAEPEFAEAHALLSAAATMLQAQSKDSAALRQLAEASAQRALELDPELPEAHLAMGETALFKPDLQRARRGYEMALQLRTSYPEANIGLAWLSLVEGSFVEAEVRIRLALEFGPETTLPYRFLYRLEAFRGDLKAAQQAIDLISERLGPEYAESLRWDLCLRQPTGDDAWQCMAPLLQEADSETATTEAADSIAAEHFRTLYFQEGWRGFTGQSLDETPISDLPLHRAALLLRFAGDREGALDELAAGIDGGSWSVFNLAVDPNFDALRGEPRFQELLRRLGLSTALRSEPATPAG